MSLITRPSGSIALPDNTLWTNRFEIQSESSNRVYVVAMNKETKKWGMQLPRILHQEEVQTPP